MSASLGAASSIKSTFPFTSRSEHDNLPEERDLPNARSACRDDRVRKGRSDRRGGRFAGAGGQLAGRGHDVDEHLLRHLVDAQDGVVVEVVLLHCSVLDRYLTEEGV